MHLFKSWILFESCNKLKALNQIFSHQFHPSKNATRNMLVQDIALRCKKRKRLDKNTENTEKLKIFE